MSDLYGDESRGDLGEGPRDVASVLDETLEVVENAKSMPLSSSALISREEVLDLLHQALDMLPTELATARRLLREREEVFERAEREAEELLDEARAQAAHLVERTEVVRQARHSAQRIIAEAEAEGRRIRHEADDYVDRKLAAFEIVLDRTVRTVRSGRERLTVVPPPPEKPDDTLPVLDGEDGLFDQDLS